MFLNLIWDYGADCWPTAVSGSMLRGVEKRQIFIGDTNGALHKFESPGPEDPGGSAQSLGVHGAGQSVTPACLKTSGSGGGGGVRGRFQFGKCHIGNRGNASRQMHALGITTLQLIPAENLLISLGYDQVVKVLFASHAHAIVLFAS